VKQLPNGWVPGEPDDRASHRCMIVGEAPGKHEWVTTRPFTGSSGQFLRKELKAAGLDPEDVYITNVVKIWPRDDNGKTRSPPSTAEIKSSARGSWCPVDVLSKSDASVLPTYHPSYIKNRPQVEIQKGSRPGEQISKGFAADACRASSERVAGAVTKTEWVSR
jgi:uracil-DNA glycosylase